MKNPNKRDDAEIFALDAEIFTVMLRHVMAVRNRNNRRLIQTGPGVPCSCGTWCPIQGVERPGMAHMRHVAEKIAERLKELG